MIKRLLIFICLSLTALGNLANAAITKEGDNLPPLIIETNAPEDLKYVGVDIDLSKSPQISAKVDTPLHKEPSPTSPIIAVLPADTGLNHDVSDLFPIVDIKAYIYPRMGKTLITRPINFKGYFIADYDTVNNVPQVNEYVYLTYANPYRPYVAWYKGHFIFLPNGVIIPNLMTEVASPYAHEKPYGIYEGYVAPHDGDVKGENRNADLRRGGYYPGGKRYIIDEPICRRNADIWICIELPNKVKGWVQMLDAHLGFHEQPNWWKAYRNCSFDY